MSKLNTDTNKKEFIKKFTIAWNTPTERWRIPADPGHVWCWIKQSLQQAYQKGREDERERLLKLCPELGKVLYWDNESVRNSKEFIERTELKKNDKD